MKQWAKATTEHANLALVLVKNLQKRLVSNLEEVGTIAGAEATTFKDVEWLRNEGAHGGGLRKEAPEGGCFNAASINISQVSYEDKPERKLASSTALSSIVHPSHPLAPSIHLHFSWTEYKNNDDGYWRMMADLNPAIPVEQDKQLFAKCLQQATADLYKKGREEGDLYFFIPQLDRHRGVVHFYLEKYFSGNFNRDLFLAKTIANQVIGTYSEILIYHYSQNPEPSSQQLQQQIEYHTVYFYQVLTLDRGTTAGLLVHADNDLGILGSLPNKIDKELFLSWAEKTEQPQDQLVRRIADCLPEQKICRIDANAKLAIAQAIRDHYTQFPKALHMQATGSIVPQTIANHLGAPD